MTDRPPERGRSTATARVTRRGVLAVGGATLLAGCGLPNPLGSGAVEVDGADVARIAAGEHPTVAEPLPVDVRGTHVAASRERAYSLLATVPFPLSVDDVPNGSMRVELRDHAEHAREHLADAARATGTRERLDLLADARDPARAVAATWAAGRGDLTLADVRKTRDELADDVASFRDERGYVGADPVRAVVVHALVEEWLSEADYAASHEHVDGAAVSALGVGEAAGRVEEGRASLADARHVHQRFVGSLSTPSSVRETVVEARESLAATIDERLASLPGRDADVLAGLDVSERTVAGSALRELHSELPYGDEGPREGGPASAVVGRVSGLANVGAFVRLRDRIEAGDHRTVESVSDVQAIRSAAVTALEAALADSADERLARTVLADLTGWFDYAERELKGYEGAVDVERLARDLALYVELAMVASATPDAVDEALAALGVA